MAERGIISVNGMWLPNPDGVEAGHNVLDKYALRAIHDALLHREIAGKKYNYDLNWTMFSDDSDYTEAWRILDQLGRYATFRILSPDGNGYIEFDGYTTGPKATMQSYYSMGEQARSQWRSLKVSIVER